ncbi:MAG: hypothetical protein RQ899_14725, partial [Pseudomonadales bacterium]|nr:hypothetical protein [Pseudomonadales bacterium]
MSKSFLCVLALGICGLVRPVGAQEELCDSACLKGIAADYMAALVAKDWSTLPWGDKVSFSENAVAMMIGEGLWGPDVSIEGIPFIAADPVSGNAVWFGVVTEHGQAAYYGMRLQVENRRITQVETLLGREGTPGTFTAPEHYAVAAEFSDTLPIEARRPRERLIALVDGYFGSKQLNDGVLLSVFAADCARTINGTSTTHGSAHWAAQAVQGCQPQLETGLYKPVDRIRERHFPVVDESRGLVVAI